MLFRSRGRRASRYPPDWPPSVHIAPSVQRAPSAHRAPSAQRALPVHGTPSEHRALSAHQVPLGTRHSELHRRPSSGRYLHKTRTVNRTWYGSVMMTINLLGSDGEAVGPNQGVVRQAQCPARAPSARPARAPRTRGWRSASFGLAVPSAVQQFGPSLAYP